MRAAVLYGPKDLKVVEIPDRACSADEVKIRVEAVGVCGTDVLVYEGLYTSNIPIVPGHEFAGVVDEVGEGVKDLKPGHRVTARGSWECGICSSCQAQKRNLCTDRRSLGRTVNGAMAEYVYVPEKAVFKLPESLDFNTAQSFIPIACANHAAKRSRIASGETAVIFGSGHSALIILQVLKAYGAEKVIVVGGTRTSRLKAAYELGADKVMSSVDLDIAYLSALKADVVIEASGSTRAFSHAIEIVRPGGVVLVYSIYNAPVDQFDATKIYSKEISVLGSKGGSGEYESAIHLLEERRISISPLISHHFELTNIAEAFRAISNKDKSMFRVVINP